MPADFRPASFRQIIDKAVKEKRFLVVPGAHDALSARIIQRLGFETYFIGGFPAVGARYGVPDVGLKGFGEIAACVRDIMAACDLPVFVDGDDGYGDVKNVVHTVQSYERMGVSAILIEDQQWPKRCGHMVGKKVVPTEIAEAKIRAVCSARLNPATWILAAVTKDSSQIFTTFGFWFANPPHFFENIVDLFAFRDGIFVRWFGNSLLYAGSISVGSTLICALAATPLPNTTFPGNTFFLTSFSAPSWCLRPPWFCPYFSCFIGSAW